VLGWIAQGDKDTEVKATVLPESRPLPAFELEGTHGSPINPETLKGNWTWVFFGFTHCPDVCPGTLSAIRDGLPLIEGEAPDVLFISLDPERDTLTKLAEYVEWFNPDFKAATGDIPALNKAAQAMGIAWSKVETESSNYQIAHTSWVILLNPSAQIQAWFSPPHLPNEMAQDFMTIRDNHQQP
jgi:protein SCO1/2